MNWIYLFDIIGTCVFALTGAIVASRHQMDLFGVIVLAAVTAVGGGTIRDAILGATPVFWLSDTNYIIAILSTVLASLLFINRPTRTPKWILPTADAAGLALFSLIGADKALQLGFDGMIATIMGLITGVGGGMIRDILCQRVPFVLREEIYATAALLAGMFYTTCLHFDIDNNIAMWGGLLIGFFVRIAALKWHISLPAFSAKDNP